MNKRGELTSVIVCMYSNVLKLAENDVFCVVSDNCILKHNILLLVKLRCSKIGTSLTFFELTKSVPIEVLSICDLLDRSQVDVSTGLVSHMFYTCNLCIE